MQRIGTYEAKTHFSKILDKVAHGECFTIEKHGVPVAVLQPVESRKKMTVSEAVEAMKEFRSGRSLDGITIRELIEEGRR